MDNNFVEVSDYVKRLCSVYGITVDYFLEVQEKWSAFFDLIREAFKTGEFDL